MEKFSTFSTLKSLTNAHTVRGRPNLKDVERFWNGSNLIYRGREHSIVKLIVNQSKLISIYNSETTTSDESYVNYGSTKDYIIFWKDEQTRFARNVTEEEHSKTTPCQPCDSECKATFPMNTFILAVNIVLLLVFSLLINGNGHFFAGLMIVTLLVLLAYVFLVDYLSPSVDVYCETIVNSLVSD